MLEKLEMHLENAWKVLQIEFELVRNPIVLSSEKMYLNIPHGALSLIYNICPSSLSMEQFRTLYLVTSQI